MAHQQQYLPKIDVIAAIEHATAKLVALQATVANVQEEIEAIVDYLEITAAWAKQERRQ